MCNMSTYFIVKLNFAGTITADHLIVNENKTINTFIYEMNEEFASLSKYITLGSCSTGVTEDEYKLHNSDFEAPWR